jgi:hypothetical protein
MSPDLLPHDANRFKHILFGLLVPQFILTTASCSGLNSGNLAFIFLGTARNSLKPMLFFPGLSLCGVRFRSEVSRTILVPQQDQLETPVFCLFVLNGSGWMLFFRYFRCMWWDFEAYQRGQLWTRTTTYTTRSRSRQPRDNLSLQLRFPDIWTQSTFSCRLCSEASSDYLALAYLP